MQAGDRGQVGPATRGARRRKPSLWRLCLLALALLAMAPALALAEATVRDIRLAPSEDGADGTRIVIDLSREVSYRHIRLEDPPRLAIDLPEVAWLVPESIGQQSFGMVTGYRFGRFRPGISRVVLDIGAPFEIRKVFELPPNEAHGYRIVTEIGAARAGGNGGLPSTVALEAAPVNGENGLAHGAPAGAQEAALTVLHPPQGKPAPSAGPRGIVIDPGHGGIDPGAIGATGSYEKDVVLAVGLELRRQLEASGRYKVIMTRQDDSTVRLRDRLEIARNSGGDLFLSLHADSLVQAPQVRGAAVYTLSEEASNQEAARLASKENRADILGGIDLSEHEDIVTQILIDLAQRDANNRSIRVAEMIVDELDDITEMLRRRRQQAGFVVLKSPDMPSVLLELGYLSNATDERRLRDEQHIRELATAIMRAIDRYFTTEAF